MISRSSTSRFFSALILHNFPNRPGTGIDSRGAMAIEDGLFSLLLEASATALSGVLRLRFALSKWKLSEIRLPASTKPK